jgi:hypothetical protein
MKSPKAERNIRFGTTGLVKSDDCLEEARSHSDSYSQIPFPTIAETLDIDQATRIFLVFVAELNGGTLNRHNAQRDR